MIVTLVWTTFKLALITTFLLLIFTSPLALWLARTPRRWKYLVEAVVALPLILPPTVLGFYLLIFLGREGPMGKFMAFFGAEPLAFTFWGLVVGSVAYSLPFVVQPLQQAFINVDRELTEAASTLGAGPWDLFWSVIFPLSRRGFLVAGVLGFAHTVGEFGVVLMIGGNIVGETQVLSIAIYDQVESLNYGLALGLSVGLLIFSFFVLSVVYALNRKSPGVGSWL